MASCFPLLRLPQVAFQHVSEQFGLAEIFFMSLCSKRTYRLIMNYQNKSDEFTIGVLVSDGDWFCYIMRDRNGKHEIISFYVEKNFETRPSSLETCISFKHESDSSNDIEFYFDWNDRFDGLKVITSYATKLFKKPVTSLSLSDESYYKDFKKLADFVTSPQNTIEDLSCNFYRVPDEDISHILRICNPTKTLTLHYNPRREYEISFSQFNAKCITIRSFVKLTLNHLKSLNCEHFDAYNTRMSMKIMNGFLKHWIDGGCSRLETIYIETESFNLAVLFDGIEMVERDKRIVRRITCVNGEQKAINGGFDITRNDGKIATILEFSSIYSTSLEMIVWG